MKILKFLESINRPFILFNYNGNEIKIEESTPTGVYTSFLDWLYDNGYKFEGELHSVKTRKVYTIEDAKNSGVDFSRFHNIKGSSLYMAKSGQPGNVEVKLDSMIKMLNNFSVDTSTVRSSGFSKMIEDPKGLSDKMTFIKAAQVILQENNNTPMSASEIWSEVFKKEMVESYGKTPIATLNANLMMYSPNSNVKKKYKTSIFEMVGNNPVKFKLLKPSKVQDESEIESEIEEVPNVYCVRGGEGNKDVSLFIENNFVGIEYHTEGFDISSKTKEEIIEFLSNKFESKRAIQQYVQQIELFKQIQKGDIILVPDNQGTNVGEVTSTSYLSNDSKYYNRLDVEWMDAKIEKNTSLNMPKTVFEVKNFDIDKMDFTGEIIDYSTMFDGDKKEPIEDKLVEKESLVENLFKQCICILGDPNAGKSVTAIEALEKESKSKFYLSIPTDLSTSMLVQFIKGDLVLNKISKMIIKAYENPGTKYTVLIDEFHKPLTIKRVNDELLQAISTKRYRGTRFISSEIAEDFISKDLEEKGFDEDEFTYHGNIKIPDNFGFILLSSKPEVIVGNRDLYDRMDIVYLTEEDQGSVNSVEDLLNMRIHEASDKKEFKEIIEDPERKVKELYSFLTKFRK